MKKIILLLMILCVSFLAKAQVIQQLRDAKHRTSGVLVLGADSYVHIENDSLASQIYVLNKISELSHTGTAGSIFFAGSDGKPTENNANLFWDNVNKRLGVGTTPSAPLTIRTDGATKLGVKILRHNSNSQFINISESDGVAHVIEASSASNPKPFLIGNLDSKPIHFLTNGTYRMVVGAGGNVGIGTTTPTEKLEINGTVKISSNNSVSISVPSGRSIRENSSSTGSVFFLDLGDVRIRDGNATPYKAGLKVGGDKFVVKNDNIGNVGIGTTNPTVKLEVNGAIMATKLVGINKSNGFIPDVNSAYVVAYDKFQVKGYDGTNYVPTVTVKGSGISLGRVGIGTTNPTEKLDVVGKGKFSSTVSGADAINNNDFVTKQQMDASSGDDLGNHIATQDITMNTNAIDFNGSKILTENNNLTIKGGNNVALSILSDGSTFAENLYAVKQTFGTVRTAFANGIGEAGDVLGVKTTTTFGNTLKWVHIHPTIGSGTANVFVKAAASFTYSTQLSEGQTGYVENISTGNITVTAPSGVTFSNKMTSSSTIVLAGHETATFIRDDAGKYRIISIY